MRMGLDRSCELMVRAGCEYDGCDGLSLKILALGEVGILSWRRSIGVLVVWIGPRYVFCLRYDICFETLASYRDSLCLTCVVSQDPG